MKKQTIFLHIGFHKTGTSALQEMLNENRDKLYDAGIYYPISLLGYPAHQELAWSLFDETPPWIDKNLCLNSDEIFAKYVSTIKATKMETTILSSEDLCTLGSSVAKLEKIKQYLQDFDVKIICYVRDQIDFLLSLYHHKIRANDYSKDFKSYLSERLDLETGFFYQRLKNWSRVFGHENIIVRNYGTKNFYKKKITSDFFHSIGAPEIVFLSNKISNIGAHPWLVALLNNINNISEISDDEVDRLTNKIMGLSRELPRVNAAQFYLDDIDYKLLKRFYLKQNIQLKKVYNVDLL